MSDMPQELSGEPNPIPAVGVEKDDINAQAILVVGAVSVLLTVVAILGTAVLYYYVKGAETAKMNVVEYQDSRDAVLKQEQQIARWDGDGTKYVIPIDVAMGLVVADLQEDSRQQAKPNDAKPEKPKPSSDEKAADKDAAEQDATSQDDAEVATEDETSDAPKSVEQENEDS